MKAIWEFLKGKKTFIVVVVGVLANGLYAMGLMPDAILPTVNTILGFLGLATLRAGVK